MERTLTDEEAEVMAREIPDLFELLSTNQKSLAALIAEMIRAGYEVKPPMLTGKPDESLPETQYGPVSDIVAALKRKGYKIFDGDLNLNIVYIRNTLWPELDKYVCRLVVFWHAPEGWVSREWPVTTYPGSHYLIRRLLNSKGCAILCEGQYLGVYSIDIHNGKYEALCQRNGDVQVYRDKNRDKKFDLDPGTWDFGEFGINCHAPITVSDGVKNYIDALVESSSAGCLVFQKVADFLSFLSLCKQSAKLYKNTFTVTLIRDTDLWATVPPVVEPDPVESEDAPSTLPAEAFEIIKHFESCLQKRPDGKIEAYPDPAHGWAVPTIGWGTVQYPNRFPVHRGDVITQEEADQYLLWEMGEKADGVRELVTVPLTSDQFAALISFSYNLGLGAFEGSTLRRKLNLGDYEGAALEFPRWNKATVNGIKQEMKGLTRRRLSEQKLFRGQRPFIIPSL